MAAASTATGSRVAELARFVVNGLVATAVHYAVLNFNLRVLGMPSAGVANFVAAWFGIAASFIGSRFFVFRRADAPMLRQALRFVALYAAVALLHGVFLHFWTDVAGLDFRIGFVIATGVATVLSYLGNKLLVFQKP